ncbi:PREDICTED: uncharacterized protein LOC104817023 isoform X1 [Tarenaya hassleriana]|uniref:uncharacterized protein LOC104817023 isoform X1 n=1 Tax=Tarenaya hassleriana TaxID=28532 RepID=UPI00053C583A|nr:PREDICTED: uncharacterized protein LOC104817023 isoform X1 [Tarenaya hassleriana]
MALPDKNLTLNTNSDPGVDLGEEDLEKLESEVLQMAQKISDYRKTLPDQLRNTLSSVLSSQQPIFPNVESASDLGPSRLTIPELEDPAEEQRCSEKLIELKERISRNIATIPTVIERMRVCIDRIDKLDSVDGAIHPAFRRRRTT